MCLYSSLLGKRELDLSLFPQPSRTPVCNHPCLTQNGFLLLHPIICSADAVTKNQPITMPDPKKKECFWDGSFIFILQHVPFPPFFFPLWSLLWPAS